MVVLLTKIRSHTLLVVLTQRWICTRVYKHFCPGVAQSRTTETLSEFHVRQHRMDSCASETMWCWGIKSGSPACKAYVSALWSIIMPVLFVITSLFSPFIVIVVFVTMTKTSTVDCTVHDLDGVMPNIVLLLWWWRLQQYNPPGLYLELWINVRMEPKTSYTEPHFWAPNFSTQDPKLNERMNMNKKTFLWQLRI